MKKPEITIGKTTIGNLVDTLAEDLGDNRALEYHSLGIKMNFREFRDKCDSVAKGLMALGIQRDEKIAIWANNLPEWVYTQYGSSKMGGVLVTVNTSSELLTSANFECIIIFYI
ncbi:MAG: AMP-binding protein [Thermodesulfobacteriota bacterium]|nr:AMP-binding protein [Thermodesulfobacteriota bacterium]